EIDAARLLAYRAAWMLSQGMACSREGAMAKLKGSETYVAAARLGMQICAGHGFSTESVMSFRWRESIVAPISGGTSQIQRNGIARSIGLRSYLASGKSAEGFARQCERALGEDIALNFRCACVDRARHCRQPGMRPRRGRVRRARVVGAIVPQRWTTGGCHRGGSEQRHRQVGHCAVVFAPKQFGHRGFGARR